MRTHKTTDTSQAYWVCETDNPVISAVENNEETYTDILIKVIRRQLAAIKASEGGNNL